MRSQFSYNSNNFIKKINKIFGGFPTFGSYNVNHSFDSDWALERKESSSLAGYFTSSSDSNGEVVLRKGNTVVMSLTPLELESHLIARASAIGNVVVSGLGLGMIALDLLSKESVRKLTILEIDTEIINMYPSILNAKSKKLWEDNSLSGRLQVIQADCYQPLSTDVLNQIGQKVDYLWCDTWNNLGDAKSFGRTQYLANQLKPKACDFWDVEVFLAIQTVIDNPSLQPKKLIDFALSTGLPLSVLTMQTKQARLYTELCYAAAKNLTLQEKARELSLASQQPSIFI